MTAWLSQPLLDLDLFKSVHDPPTFEQRVLLSYQRAKAVAHCYSKPPTCSELDSTTERFAVELDLDDVSNLTPKFWDLHSDPIFASDGAAATLLSIHYNLFLGTLAPYCSKHPELERLVKDALSLNIM